jgi:hypothetical protein
MLTAAPLGGVKMSWQLKSCGGTEPGAWWGRFVLGMGVMVSLRGKDPESIGGKRRAELSRGRLSLRGA